MVYENTCSICNKFASNKGYAMRHHMSSNVPACTEVWALP